MKLFGVDTSLPSGHDIIDSVVSHTISIHKQTNTMPSINAVAASMGYSTRTLQRHLENEANISFIDISLQIKRNLIAKHICTDIPISEISDRCGFTTRSSIMRFVRRTWQCTCSELRRKANNLTETDKE